MITCLCGLTPTVCVCVCILHMLLLPAASQTEDLLFSLETVVYKDPQTHNGNTLSHLSPCCAVSVVPFVSGCAAINAKFSSLMLRKVTKGQKKHKKHKKFLKKLKRHDDKGEPLVLLYCIVVMAFVEMSDFKSLESW